MTYARCLFIATLLCVCARDEQVVAATLSRSRHAKGAANKLQTRALGVKNQIQRTPYVSSTGHNSDVDIDESNFKLTENTILGEAKVMLNVQLSALSDKDGPMLHDELYRDRNKIGSMPAKGS